MNPLKNRKRYHIGLAIDPQRVIGMRRDGIVDSVLYVQTGLLGLLNADDAPRIIYAEKDVSSAIVGICAYRFEK